jgi:hypothetical protein
MGSALLALLILLVPQADILTNVEIGKKLQELALMGPQQHEERVRLLWTLMMRSVQGDPNAHKIGKPHAERLKEEDPMDYYARFAYGYFRYRETWDTADPVTRTRRLQEGRKNMLEATQMGGRNPGFLLDAGLVMSNLRTEAELFKTALNTLTLARRTFGDAFQELPPERQADWFAAMAQAFLKLDLHELARDHYQKAYELAPDSPSGRKAHAWLRTHGG